MRIYTYMKFKLALFGLAFVLIASGFVIILPDQVSAADTRTWDGGGGDVYAGTHANWVGDVAPIAGDSIVFDSGALPCTWNLSLEFASFTISAGYTGVVTQGASFSVTSFSVGGGTFTPSKAYTLTCSGNFAKTGGLITGSLLRLIMTGSGTTINAIVQFFDLDIQNDVTLTSNALLSRNINVAADKTFTLNGLLYWYHWWSGDLTNSGTIAGTNALRLTLYNVSQTVSFGNFNADLIVVSTNTATANRVLSLGEDTALGGDLTISSEHTTYTTNLTHGANYELTVSGATTLSARARMASGTGTWTFDTYVQSGASSLFNQGGTVIVSNGYLQSDGIFTGSTGYWVECGGDFNKTAGFISKNVTRLKMYTDDTSIVSNNATIFYDLQLEANVTVASSTGVVIFLHCLNVSSGKTVTIVNILYWYDWHSGNITNDGTLTGIYRLEHILYSQDVYRDYGSLDIKLKIRGLDTELANRTVTLTDDLHANLLEILSSHATRTMTLDVSENNYSIFADGITLGTRAVLKSRGSEIYIAGNAFGPPRSATLSENHTAIDGDGQWLGPGNQMVQCDNGDYLAFIRNATTHVAIGDYGYMELYRSTDGWNWVSEGTLVSVATRDIRNYAAGVSQTGRIFVFYAVYDADNLTALPTFDYKYSDDNGTSWSANFTMTMPTLNGTTPEGCSPYGAMIQIGGGGIAISSYTYTATVYQVRFIYSFDDGYSWNQSVIRDPDLYRDETALAYLGDDRLIAMTRITGTTLEETTTSTDNGLTWTYRGTNDFGLTINNPPLLFTSEDDDGTLWVIALLFVSNCIYTAGYADDLMEFGTSAWSNPTNIGGGGSIVMPSMVFDDTLKTGLIMVSDEQSLRASTFNISLDSTPTYTWYSDTSDVFLSLDGAIFNVKTGANPYNLTIGAEDVRLFIADGRIGNDLTINTSQSARIEQDTYIMNQFNLYGELNQHGFTLNMSGNSSSPIIGFGTFDGDIYLNGTVAENYTVQVGIPTGNIHTDRETLIYVSPTAYIGVTASGSDFIGISITSLSQWTTTLSNESTSVSYSIRGLSTSYGYRIYQDGDLVFAGAGTTLSFTEDGSGVFTVERWEGATISRLVVLTVDMIGLGIVVSVIAGFVIPFTRAMKTKRTIPTDVMIRDAIKTVVFIVIALLMWGLLHQIAIG